MVKTHELKILPQFFFEIIAGNKKFELRKNDRDFQVGDYLILKEWDGSGYTGLSIRVRITYILKPFDLWEPIINNNYCILSIIKVNPLEGGEQ